MGSGSDEDKLVARLKRRDEAAFNDLVRELEAPVFRLVLRLVGDRAEAEDLTQEVFITVFKSIDGFRGDAKLSTWVYRVAVNHCKNRLKYFNRRSKSSQKEFDESIEQATSGATMATSAHLPRPDEVVEGEQMERVVKAALSSLDEEQRELVVLRDIEHLSYEEIQQITGLPEGTVKSRLHRARMTLQERVRRATGGDSP